MKAPTRRNAMSSGERWLRSELSEESVANSGNFKASLSGTVINEINASKSGISNNTKFANNLGSDGRDSMDNIMSLQALPVVQDTSSQRLDKGKDMVSFANGLDLTQIVERYREKELVLKEAKRRRADMGLEGIVQTEVDVSSMVVDLKNELAVGPVFQAHRE